METYPDFGYGQRPDGTNKGPGFAAQILHDGAVMTEYSLGPAGALYPAVYQGITPWDMETLSNVYQYGYDPLHGRSSTVRTSRPSCGRCRASRLSGRQRMGRRARSR